MTTRVQTLVVFALVGAAACGGRTRTVGGPASAADDSAGAEPAADADAGSEAPAVRAVTHLALEIEAATDAQNGESEVRLVVTDETGAARREDLGLYIGTCQDVTRAERAAADEPLFAFRCEGESARGVLVHVLWRAPELVLLRDWLDDDETAFDEIDRIALRPGVPITTD